MRRIKKNAMSDFKFYNEKSNQKEIRLTLQEAKELITDLALITGRLGKTIEEIHGKLDKLIAIHEKLNRSDMVSTFKTCVNSGFTLNTDASTLTATGKNTIHATIATFGARSKPSRITSGAASAATKWPKCSMSSLSSRP